MEVQQPRHVAGVDPAHSAFGADTPVASACGGVDEGGVDVLDLLGGRARCLIVRVVGERMIEYVEHARRSRGNELLPSRHRRARRGVPDRTRRADRLAPPALLLSLGTLAIYLAPQAPVHGRQRFGLLLRRRSSAPDRER